MAAGPFLFPDKTLLNFETIAVLGLTSNFKASLHASTWTPVPATDELFADATGELATGGGYTAGGVALTSVAISQTSGVVKFTSAASAWTASGGGIPVWRRLVIYYNGTISGKLNPLICYCLGDATNVDVPVTTAGNTITFTPSGTGILRVARA